MDEIRKTVVTGTIFPRWFSVLWAYLQDSWVAIRPTRFSAIGIVVVWAVLGIAGQGQDFLVRIGTEPVYVLPSIGLLAFATLFAFVVWYCARKAVDTRYEQHADPSGEERSEEEALAARRTVNPAKGHDQDPKRFAEKRARWIVGLRVYLPRLLGSLAFVAVGIAVWWAHERAVTLNDPQTAANLKEILIGLAVLGVLATLFFWMRRPLARAVERRGMAVVVRLLGAKASARDDVAKSDDRVLLRSPFLLVLSVVLLGFLVVSAVNPVIVGGWFGSVSVFFLIISALVSIGTVLVIFCRRYNLPLFFALFIMLFVVSGYFSNHQIRLWPVDEADGPGATFISERSSPTDAFDQWLAANGVTPQSTAAEEDEETGNTGEADTPVPLFVIASAGGGSRAAYWTVTALGYLQDKYPTLADHMFMLSGVSGGALGSAVFAALVSCDRDPECTLPDDFPDGMGRFEGTGTRMLSNDFLAAPLAAMFTRDVVPFLFHEDRGAALEQAWEQAWQDVFDGRDLRFGWPLSRLWPKDRPWPAVLLNGTIVETGARVITSNLNLEKTVMMEDVTDALGVSGHDVRLSTAANNSARFPIVGPASTLLAPDRDTGNHGLHVEDESCLKGSRPPSTVGEFRIVDGGYFENFGATTALEILREIRNYLDCEEQLEFREYNVRPVVIQITSDPDFDPKATVTTKPLEPLPQMRAPLEASLKTRNAHGGIAMAALFQYAIDQGWGYYHLRMCSNRNKLEDPRRKPVDPPLGWALSNQSANEIRGYLGTDKERCNAETLAELFELLDKTLGPEASDARPPSGTVRLNGLEVGRNGS